ncbi:MAG: hypothetical protein ACOC2L_03965 [Candidatus Sumerlaeota bacterium]
MTKRICILLAIGGISVLLAGGNAVACTTPVFQYAMQRWDPNEYFLQVPRQTQDGEPWGENLKAISKPQGEAYTNLVVELADKDDPTTKVLNLYQYDYYGDAVKVWSSPATPEALSKVSDSPVRSRIAKDLTNGKAAVFILLLSGDEKRDAKVRTILNTSLPKLAKELQETTAEMPDAEAALMDPLFAAPEDPVVLRFSIVELRRDDAQEEALVAMLRQLGPEYIDGDEPVVVPVFGQGRALAVLPEEYITEEYLREIGLFITGPCSCVVKDQNPGFDLLMTADWDSAEYELVDPSAATQEIEEPEIELSGVGAEVTSEEEIANLGELRQKVAQGVETSATLSQGNDSANDETIGFIGRVWMIIAGLAVLVLLVPVAYKILKGNIGK